MGDKENFELARAIYREGIKNHDDRVKRLERERVLDAMTGEGPTKIEDFLDWLADRLVIVYGENPDCDFVQSLKIRAEQIRGLRCGTPINEKTQNHSFEFWKGWNEGRNENLKELKRVLGEIEDGLSVYEKEHEHNQVSDECMGMYIPINVVRRLIEVRKP